MKKKIILLTIFISIIIAYIIIINNYKYYNSKIEEKNNNYNYSDIAIYLCNNEDCTTFSELDKLPNGSEYTINTAKSYCYKNNEEEKHTDRLYTNSNGEHIIKDMEKGERCFIYFNKVEQKGITIIAKTNNEAINFPSEEDNYTPTSITCDNEVTAKFDYTNWEVEVDAIENTDVTCTVNFEKFELQTFNTYLKNKQCKIDKASITDEQAKDCLIDEGETGNNPKNYRYEGSNPNNYVIFNDELWRIIGVFNVETESNGKQDLVKLIRAEVLDGLAWNSTNTNTWEGGSLEKSLNEKYINAEDDSNCYVSSTTVKKTCYFSETGIKSGAREKIEAVKWNIGVSEYSENVNKVYGTETSSKTSTYYKVGLMSASDYGYAVLGSSCKRSTTLSNYGDTRCAGLNWLKIARREYTLTPSRSSSSAVLSVVSYGEGAIGNEHANGGCWFRSSIYLKSSEQVIGGTGTHDNPYILTN